MCPWAGPRVSNWDWIPLGPFGLCRTCLRVNPSRRRGSDLLINIWYSRSTYLPTTILYHWELIPGQWPLCQASLPMHRQPSLGSCRSMLTHVVKVSAKGMQAGHQRHFLRWRTTSPQCTIVSIEHDRPYEHLHVVSFNDSWLSYCYMNPHLGLISVLLTGWAAVQYPVAILHDVRFGFVSSYTVPSQSCGQCIFPPTGQWAKL